MEKRITAISLTLIILTILLITGCSGGETTTPAATTPPAATTTTSPFTEQELQQIVADSRLATMDANTFKLEMDVTSTASVDGGSEEGMSIKAQGAFDEAQNQLMMTLEMTESVADGGAQTNNAELYVLADYIYVGATIPEIGEQWLKMPVTEEILDIFNANMIQEEMNVLDSPASIEFVEYGDVRGIECYVVKIVPDEEYLREYAQEQMNTNFEIEWDKINNVSEIYNELSYLVWIAKDTKYVHKMDITAIIELNDDFARSDDISFNEIITNVSGSLEIYDYNVPAAIDLPEEAEDAIEISPDMFTGQ